MRATPAGPMLALVAPMLSAPFALAGAQGVRITGSTLARYVEVRPVVTDSVPRSSVVDSVGTLYFTAPGLTVRCEPHRTYCSYVRSTDPISTVPLTQDVQLIGWGFGQGVSVFAHVRGRAALGEADELWPLADDAFDALAAYVEVDRARFRVRAGRQWVTSGLGYYNFDGASLLVRPVRAASVDVFGGWSLARGLNEPRTSGAIAAVEDIVPDQRAYLVGLELQVHPNRRWAAGALYQREIETSREALFSERVALDGHLFFPRGALDAQVEGDLATGALNEAWLRGNYQLGRSLGLRADLRHYVPFFELWTIWGVFAPAGFDEARVGAYWGSGAEALSAQVTGGYRRYQETNAGFESFALRDDGWRGTADAAWRFRPQWLAHTAFAVDLGFGATRTDGDLGVRWDGDRLSVGARASAFQSVFEFRVGTGRVIGAGLDAGLTLTDDVRAVGDVSIYRHRDAQSESGGPAVNWSQMRGSLRLQWSIGRDPALPATMRGSR